MFSAYMHSETPVLNIERIGTHHGKIFTKRVLHGINGCQNTHQSHNTKSNDEYCQYGTHQMAFNGNKSYPDVFPDQIYI